MKRVIFAVLMTSLLAACASSGMSKTDKLALYRSHAGQPVKDFQYFGINGWTPLGDKAIAIWTKPTQAYLLDLVGPCPDLEYAQAISVSSQLGRVSTNFDKVTPLGSGLVNVPCRITQIRPLDVKAIRQGEKTAREEAQVSGT